MPAWSPPSACRVVSSRRSVIFDIAETTATTGRRAASCAIRSQAALIRSAEPTLVPPNFITSRPSVFRSRPFVLFAIGNSRPDQLQDFLFDLLRSQARRIEIHRVRSLHQRRFRTEPVAFIAL